MRFRIDTYSEEEDPKNTSNNSVWIEHDNGEWTNYSHMRTGSIPADVVVGEPITVGTPIGIEGDVGYASGERCAFQKLDRPELLGF